jgi:hypothetical protein
MGWHVDAGSFNGKRMHHTEMNEVVRSKKGLGNLFNKENREYSILSGILFLNIAEP